MTKKIEQTALTKELATALLLDGTRGLMGRRSSMLHPINVITCEHSFEKLNATEIAFLKPLKTGMSLAKLLKFIKKCHGGF